MRHHSTRGLAVRVSSLSLSFFLYLCMLPIIPRSTTHAQGLNIPVIAPASAYRQINLVSDIPGLAPVLECQRQG